MVTEQNRGFRADRLRQLRKERELTQHEFAESIQVDQSQYARYEKAHTIPSLEIAARIAEEFKVSLDWLVGLSDTREISVPTEETPNVDERLLAAFHQGDLKLLLNIVLREFNRRE